MSSKMLRRMALGLTGALVMMVGCGSNTEQGTSGATEASANVAVSGSVEASAVSSGSDGITVFDGSLTVQGGPYKVAFCSDNMGNSFRIQWIAEFENACQELQEAGVVSEYYVTNADGDVSKQISDMRDLITKNVDVIVISAASGTALTDVCDEAMEQGIKVVSCENYLEYEDGEVHETARLGAKQQEFGRIWAEWLVEQLDGKGNIILLQGMAGTLGSEQRWEGAAEVFENYPDIKILGEAYGDWDYAKGKQAAEQLIAAYGEQIDAVWSQGGAMTQGCIDAYNEKGMELVPMTGEANNGMLKAWLDNRDKGFTSIAPNTPTYDSAMALELGLRACEGEDVSGFHELEIMSVTEESLEEYVKPELSDGFWVFTKLSDDQVKKLFEE